MKKYIPLTLTVCGLAALASVAIPAQAGESGFIRNGEVHVVYRDGKKVGKSAEELGFVAPAGTEADRKVASITRPDKNNEIYQSIIFQDDGLSRCYTYLAGNSGSLSCVRKDVPPPKPVNKLPEE